MCAVLLFIARTLYVCACETLLDIVHIGLNIHIYKALMLVQQKLCVDGSGQRFRIMTARPSPTFFFPELSPGSDDGEEKGTWTLRG